MSSFSDHQHHVRRVVLPSGKTIEVVYFDDVDAPAATPEHRDALHVCPSCSSELVHPVAWHEAGPDHWDVELLCPNCAWVGNGTYDQDAVDCLDVHLDLGTEALLRDLARLTHANMQDGIDRFVAALGADLIVPEDF